MTTYSSTVGQNRPQRGKRPIFVLSGMVAMNHMWLLQTEELNLLFDFIVIHLNSNSHLSLVWNTELNVEGLDPVGEGGEGE